MGSSPDDTTVLFLFISFAILIVLSLLLIVVCCQTWMLWKLAKAVVEDRSRGVVVEKSYGYGGKRRRVRSEVFGGDEERGLMSGANGTGEDGGARKKGFGGLGRWF